MVTFGEMRVRDVLVYCRDHRFSHHIETNADGWADDMRPSDTSRSSPAPNAASAAPRPGRISHRRESERVRFFASDGFSHVKDYRAGLQTLRKDAANCAVIRDRATDQRKRELYDRLSQHLNPLADEVAWAMAKARDQN